MGRRIIYPCSEAKESINRQALKNELLPEKTQPAVLSQTTEPDAFSGMTDSPLLSETTEPGTTEFAMQTGNDVVLPDDYKTKVIKYIPAEIVTAYVTMKGIIEASAPVSNTAHWVVFLILLVLTPLYIWRVTDQANQKPAWDQIIVAFFSFIIWVMALGGPFTALPWYEPLYAALILPIYTLIIPLMIRK